MGVSEITVRQYAQSPGTKYSRVVRTDRLERLQEAAGGKQFVVVVAHALTNCEVGDTVEDSVSRLQERSSLRPPRRPSQEYPAH